MKQNALLKQGRIEEECAATVCLASSDCKVINMEERRQKVESPPLQLYAKEAEHYFFYYDVNLKQLKLHFYETIKGYSTTGCFAALRNIIACSQQ